MPTFLKIASLVMRSIYRRGWLVVAHVALPIIGFFVAGIVGDLTGWYRIEDYITMQ